MYMKWLIDVNGNRVEEEVAVKAFQDRTDLEAVLNENGWNYATFFLTLEDAVGLMLAQASLRKLLR